MNAITAGPWTVDLYDAPFEMAQIKDSAGYQIGAVDVAGRKPEDIANARLIAASPDLLSVLIQAVEAEGFSLSGPTNHNAAENGEPAWVCNARLAIAKATGEA